MSVHRAENAFLTELYALTAKHDVHGFVLAFTLKPSHTRAVESGWGGNKVLEALSRTLNRVMPDPRSGAPPPED
jgi:hypothetical protein